MEKKRIEKQHSKEQEKEQQIDQPIHISDETNLSSSPDCDEKVVFSIKRTGTQSEDFQNQIIYEQRVLQGQGAPKIRGLPRIRSYYQKSTEPGFEGTDADSWFDEREIKKTLIAPMHGQDPNDQYFDSYSHYYIHEEMIKDKIRTETYLMAIKENSECFKDKIVLDIGCGTGILSIFAARAGAKHVYAVDGAEIAEYAKKIVETNGLSSQITIIKGKVEEIELPVQKVDIIISEWMGYFLLYESMLDTVIFARDKWLNLETGIIMPDQYYISIAGYEDKNNIKESKMHFWKDVYDIDMECLGQLIYVEPSVETIDPTFITTTACRFFHLDLYTCKKEDAQFAQQYSLTADKESAIVDALCAWFDVEFSTQRGLKNKFTFTTSPYNTPTHWRQTNFYIDYQYELMKGDELFGTLAIRKSKKHPRELDIKISFNCRDAEQVEFDQQYIQYFQMT